MDDREDEKGPGETAPEAERIYEEFLTRRLAGEEADWDELRAAWPRLGVELERLHRQYELFVRFQRELD